MFSNRERGFHAFSSSKGDDSRFPRLVWISIDDSIVTPPRVRFHIAFPRFFDLLLLPPPFFFLVLVVRSYEFTLFLALLVHKSSFGADDRIHDTYVPLSLFFSLERRATTTSRGRSFKVSSSHVCWRWSSFTFSAQPTRVRVPSARGVLFSDVSRLVWLVHRELRRVSRARS